MVSHPPLAQQSCFIDIDARGSLSHRSQGHCVDPVPIMTTTSHTYRVYPRCTSSRSCNHDRKIAEDEDELAELPEEEAEQIRRKAGFEAKVCVLGHIQRGGPPTARDRILASRLGYAAVRVLQQGLSNIMVGVQSGQVVPPASFSDH